MVKGYKVFNSDWTCRNMQYTCPGMFEMEEEPIMCEQGFHFCTNINDCLQYYHTDIANYHFAEVIAHGTVIQSDDPHADSKCCTNKLEIVRELSREEVIKLTSTGANNTGLSNTGSFNSGSMNTGNENPGNYNTGHSNIGDYNTGNGNLGLYNTGYKNTGSRNSGTRNAGNYNVGDYNYGNGNVGNFNVGDYNVGDTNTGAYNIGDHNSGCGNVGDWNATNYSMGCFNTIRTEEYIPFFNKPSRMTWEDWYSSGARAVMQYCPTSRDVVFVYDSSMTDEEKESHPEWLVNGGYLRVTRHTTEDKQKWWDGLLDFEKSAVMNLPNFDADIFKECTGIEVRKNEEKD